MVALNRKTRAAHWSVTAFFGTENTPSKQTREYQIDQARALGWSVEGQEEKCPTTGNHHYQLMVSTGQQRAAAVMDAFPASEVQIARNPNALANYVSKDDTRVGQLPTKKVILPVTYQLVRDKFFQWVVANQEDDMDYSFHPTHPDEVMRLWDRYIGLCIEDGQDVDVMGVNPQYRSAIMKYFSAFIARARQTDRQTEQKDAESINIPTTIDVSQANSTQPS